MVRFVECVKRFRSVYPAMMRSPALPRLATNPPQTFDCVALSGRKRPGALGFGRQVTLPVHGEQAPTLPEPALNSNR